MKPEAESRNLRRGGAENGGFGAGMRIAISPLSLVGGTIMAHSTRFFRRQIYRPSRERYSWRVVRRSHVRRALQALEALYRRA